VSQDGRVVASPAAFTVWLESIQAAWRTRSQHEAHQADRSAVLVALDLYPSEGVQREGDGLRHRCSEVGAHPQRHGDLHGGDDHQRQSDRSDAASEQQP
jgi:hypothetical protein